MRRDNARGLRAAARGLRRIRFRDRHHPTGRIAPSRVADVRPQVSGIVVERLFRQGS